MSLKYQIKVKKQEENPFVRHVYEHGIHVLSLYKNGYRQKTKLYIFYQSIMCLNLQICNKQESDLISQICNKQESDWYGGFPATLFFTQHCLLLVICV
jgi:hypothetical protein